jgi:hypothetical protein
MRTHKAGLLGLALAAVVAPVGMSAAWDAPGHRLITWLALDGLRADAPAFLREPAHRHMAAWQAAEADRWRGTNIAALRHENAPEHFIDIEDLEQFGLTLDTINPLRARFIADMAVARHVHPENMSKPYNPKFDPAGDQEWPGFAPHAAMELYGKLTSSFKTFRALTKLNDPARGPQLEMAKANILVQLGHLSHIVGDLAQPLHTTKHFNGWVGENPEGFTTARTFHAYIDGGVLAHHGLNYAALKPAQRYEVTITDASNPWGDLLAYIRRSHEQVRPLYEMEKSGALKEEAGKALISSRLGDAGAMLAALINSAWEASEIDDKYVADFIRFDGFKPEELPADAR